MCDKPSPYSYRVKSIKKIIDGDTFDCILDLGFDVLLEARVRMMGIDTPESRTRNLAEKALGLKAKDRLIEICTSETLQIKSLGKGKYGRILGVPYVDGEDVCQKLIDEDHAVEYWGGTKTKIWG